MSSSPREPRVIPGAWWFWALQRTVLVALAFTSFFPVFFRYQEHAVVILFPLCLGMCWLERVNPWVRSPVDLPLGLFIGWVLCTVPFAVDPAYSFAEWKKVVAQTVVFYWALLIVKRTDQEELPRWILGSLVLGGVVVALYALGDFFARGGTWRDRFVRAHAFNSDYNWLSTYMVLVIPLIGSLAVVTRTAWVRGLQMAALAVTVAAQVFSYTRGGWVGHAAQAVVVGFLWGGRRVAGYLLGGFLLMAVGLIAVSQWGIQTDTVAIKTVDTRLTIWRIGLGALLESPVVGIGYGNNSFLKKFPEYSMERQAHLPEPERILPAVHNAFLMVALGSGLPALGLLLWMLCALLRRIFSLAGRSHGRNPATVLSAGVGLAILGFAVRNLFDYMFMGSLAHLFWLLAAVGVTWSMWDERRAVGDISPMEHRAA